jgi:GrpB-like predicted nucleotidyltransferase (UPF0157 family)
MSGVRTHPLWRPYQPPTEEEIAAARVSVHRPVPVEVVDYDPTWPARFRQVKALIVDALGPIALSVTHVGSTSVPGLPAKAVIDIDLSVADSADEGSYLPALEGVGFRLAVREPEWEEHRCLRLDDPATNLHVFSSGAAERQRMLAFAAWLREHPDDRRTYGELKREVARRGFTDVMLYNNAKSAYVYDLYEKIFAADPAHLHDPHPRD